MTLRILAWVIASSWCLAASAQDTGSAVADPAMMELLQAHRAGEADRNQTLQLLSIVLQDPERIARAGAFPDSVRAQLLRSEVVLRADPEESWVRSPLLTPPDSVEAERLFQRALDAAPSDKARADYVYARYTKGYGGGGCTRALKYYPAHGPCQYQQLVEMGRRVGTKSTVEGRFKYWCLADRFRQLAASVDDERIARAAQRAARQYERSGPTRAESRVAGYVSGQIVTVPLDAETMCQTPVR